VAPEMAIACRRTVDRMQKIKVADDGEWAQVEDLAHRGDDLVMRDGFRSKGVQRDRGRLRLADRIGNLKLAAAGQSGGYDVLGDPAARICRRAVHLGWILAREGAAAMSGHAAIAVHDDLAPGQA